VLTLGSLFAVGGIGSASFVLALRGTMENLVGGILLRLQDKFRVDERISVPGESLAK
jgi:small-conductance mechanosensitive channel